MNKSCSLLSLLVLSLGLLSCSKPPPDDPYRNRRAPPLPVTDTPSTAPVSGMGSVRDRIGPVDHGTFRVKEETWHAVGLHDTRTMCRTRSPEEEKEFERLVEKGRIKRIPVGTMVKRLNDKRQEIDGNVFDLMRVELVDDPDVHGNIMASAVEQVK